LAATKSKHESDAFQQLVVSHVAHDTLIWTFHGTRLCTTINSKLNTVIGPIGLDSISASGKNALSIGRESARKVAVARADDGINYFIDYTKQAALPGVYQATPGGYPIPGKPQARHVRLFGGVGDVTRFTASPAAYHQLLGV
jgi:hypothetical protein